MRRTNSLCVLACHPIHSGRPSRMQAIESSIEFALDRGDIRFSQLADIVLGEPDK